MSPQPPPLPPKHPDAGAALGSRAPSSLGGSVRERPALGRVSTMASLARTSVEIVGDLARVVVEPAVTFQPGGPLDPAVAQAAAAAAAEDATGVVKPVPGGGVLADDGVRRRGGVMTGVMHTITAVVGAGVLTLPAAMATLGYVGGCLTLLFAAVVTLYTSQLLADLYVVGGVRQRTYTGMVKTVMGRTGELVIGVVQLGNLALTALAYQVTAGKTLRAIAHSLCGVDPVHAADGGSVAHCFDSYWVFVVLFGVLQLGLSQIPSLESLASASIVGAASAAGYSVIALALNIANIPPAGKWLGSAWGSPEGGGWADLSAIGNILFAFSFSFMLLEIQDTMRGDGTAAGAVKPMKLAVNISMAFMTVFYYAISLTGYATWGDHSDNKFGRPLPDDVLTGYPGPRWAIILANILVMLHMIPAYQVWSQPLFECTELALEERMHKRGGWPRGLSERAFRLAFRSVYVVLTTFLACLVPFMGVILGLAGALGFWPASVWAPVECYIKVFRPRRGVSIALRVLSTVCAIVTVACVVSGLQQLVVSASGFRLFEAGS